MEFDAILIPPRRSTMTEQGLWANRTINDDLDACVASCPDQVALTAVSLESGTVTRFTYREMAAMADRIAVGLSRLGVGRNDVVSMQLPNWWQFTLTYLACSRIGAVLNPLMHIFRERELSFMLKHGDSKVVIVPKQFRGFDHEQMIVGLRPNLPALQHIVVVGSAGDNSFEKLLSGPRWEEAPDAKEILTRHRPSPDDITQLIYTSGTTGEPKGVMHSANTTMANIIPYAERLCLGSDDVVLMASPMAHQTGFMYGLMMPIMLRSRAVLQDIWDPKKALELIRSEGVTFTMASTPFLTDLAKAVSESGEGVPTLRSFLCAGAPIPGPLVENARKVLGAKIVSAWGMTEIGAVTLIKLDDDDERAFNTAGCPLPGVELRVVDAAGKPLPNGTEGTLLVRSCSNFGGYLRRPHLNSTDEEGWFDTGDLAEIDDRGYVRITGRSKDVIIRGGENIPVVEIETLLYRHPAISQVAIVAYSDDRLGERGCAVVVPKQGQALDLPAIVDFLKSQKVALQYIPERLLVLDQMPATPSGKIQKFRLREIVKQPDSRLKFTTPLRIDEEKNMTTYQDIIYEERPKGVARITINRPTSYNAFRGNTVEELIHAFQRAGWDKSIGVIVLTGAGDKAFCTGGDQGAHDGQYDGRGTIGLPIDELQSVIRDMPKPVIARVNGFAIGGGNVLATICDLTIASDKAQFGQVGPKVGSVDPGFGTAYLSRVVGEKKAREIWYLNRRYSAAKAVEMGLANVAVPHDELDAEVDRWCEEILERSPTAIALAKRSFNADTESIRGIASMGMAALSLYYDTEESKEGGRAYHEKRKPDFRKFSR